MAASKFLVRISCIIGCQSLEEECSPFLPIPQPIPGLEMLYHIYHSCKVAVNTVGLKGAAPSFTIFNFWLALSLYSKTLV